MAMCSVSTALRVALLAAPLSLTPVPPLPSRQAAAPQPPGSVDRPLGTISCDRLGIAAALPDDVAEDDRLAPNHCLVRLFSFPTIAPLDLPIESIELRGATSGRRVAPGEYLFENVALSYTSIVVRDLAADAAAASGAGETDPDLGFQPAASSPSEVPPAPPAPAVGRRRSPPIASRNPLLLARHATTRCDLYVAQEASAAGTLDLHGVVIDRVTGAPVEGALVRCGNGEHATTTTTGVDGRYRFAEPTTYAALLEGMVVTKAGYAPSSVGSRQLPSPWVDRFRLDGSAAFLLFPADRAKLRSPLLPTLGR